MVSLKRWKLLLLSLGLIAMAIPAVSEARRWRWRPPADEVKDVEFDATTRGAKLVTMVVDRPTVLSRTVLLFDGTTAPASVEGGYITIGPIDLSDEESGTAVNIIVDEPVALKLHYLGSSACLKGTATVSSGEEDTEPVSFPVKIVVHITERDGMYYLRGGLAGGDRSENEEDGTIDYILVRSRIFGTAEVPPEETGSES